jgi:hypothetical protein
MKNLRTYCIYALISLSFSTVIAIIEFIHFDNQTWHDIACRFLFPLLALLIVVSVTALIFAPCIGRQSKRASENQRTETQDNNSTQSKVGNSDTQDTTKQATPEGKQDKTPDNQPMQTTPTMQESKVSYKSTFVEYTASKSGSYHQSANEATENGEQSNKEEQTP